MGESYQIQVEKIPVDAVQEHQSRERFHGSGTYGVYGLGYREPSVIEKYQVNYPEHMQGRYGTIKMIGYAASANGSFERMMVDICQVGIVDLIRENGEIKDGPDWATMAKEVALVSMKNLDRVDLEKVMGQMSFRATTLLRFLIS